MFAVKAPFSCPKSSEVTVSKFMSVSATLTKGPSALAQQINQDIDDDFQGMGHTVYFSPNYKTALTKMEQVLK